MEENISISTESIYRLILKDKVADGSLYRYLRHQGKKYRKRYGQNDYRGRIPNRVDIADRPRIVDSRSRIGDWEADCVSCKSTALGLYGQQFQWRQCPASLSYSDARLPSIWGY